MTNPLFSDLNNMDVSYWCSHPKGASQIRITLLYIAGLFVTGFFFFLLQNVYYKYIVTWKEYKNPTFWQHFFPLDYNPLIVCMYPLFLTLNKDASCKVITWFQIFSTAVSSTQVWGESTGKFIFSGFF